MPRLVNCQPYFKIRSPGVRSLVANQGAWTVPDLCRAYSWPSNLAGGGVIAIVELDGGWVAADMAAFFSGIGQPLPQITDVSVDGTQNRPNQHLGNPRDPDVEVALDIQIAAAAYYVATGRPATIRVYWAQDIAPAIIRATADGCDVCSISWGSDEANWVAAGNQSGQNLIGQLEDAVRAATGAGMVVFAASGDNDSSDGGPTPANVDAPASCPHVIGCGGTTKTAATEVVWNNNPGNTDGHGTGGGYSTVFLVQSWQAGAPNGPGRMVPDVAANANLETGYWNFIHNAWTQTGGTSCVAPLYSGLFASFGRKLGWVTPKLWLNHLCFTDITQGDNGFYRARIGPDACTGLGVPIGTKLAGLLGQQPAAVAAPALATTPAAPPWLGVRVGGTGSPPPGPPAAYVKAAATPPPIGPHPAAAAPGVPGPFAYTLMYRKERGPQTVRLIPPPASRWLIEWDGHLGTASYDKVSRLKYNSDTCSLAPDGSKIWFHWFEEPALPDGSIRKWALEVNPRPHVGGDPTPLCEVAYCYNDDQNTYTTIGLATKG